MGWIVESLFNVMVELCGDILKACVWLFSGFNLDVGVEKTNDKSAFYDIFCGDNGLLSYKELFMVMGLVAAALLAYGEIIKAMTASDLRSQHPIKTIGWTAIALAGTQLAYDIFAVVQGFANQFYAGSETIGLPGFKEIFMQTKNDAFAELVNVKMLIDAGEFVGKVPEFNIDFYTIWRADVFDFGEVQVLPTIYEGIGSLFITLVFFTALTIQLIRLMLEIYERYVVLWFLWITAPLAAGCLASEGGRRIGKSWVQMIISQFLMIMFSSFFLAVFMGAFLRVMAPHEMVVPGVDSTFRYMGEPGRLLHDLQNGATTTEMVIFEDIGEFVQSMIFLISWLILGQKVDQHIQSLGLTTAQAGGGLSSAVIAGYTGWRAAVGMTKTAVRGVNKAGKAATSLEHKIGGSSHISGFKPGAGASATSRGNIFASQTRPGLATAGNAGLTPKGADNAHSSYGRGIAKFGREVGTLGYAASPAAGMKINPAGGWASAGGLVGGVITGLDKATGERVEFTGTPAVAASMAYKVAGKLQNDNYMGIHDWTADTTRSITNPNPTNTVIGCNADGDVVAQVRLADLTSPETVAEIEKRGGKVSMDQIDVCGAPQGAVVVDLKKMNQHDTNEICDIAQDYYDMGRVEDVVISGDEAESLERENIKDLL